MTKHVQACLHQANAAVLGSPREFKPYGQCGTEFSDFLPHLGIVADDIAFRSMHTEAFNHHPGQLADDRHAEVRPAEHGRVAELRPRQRIRRTCPASSC